MGNSDFSRVEVTEKLEEKSIDKDTPNILPRRFRDNKLLELPSGRVSEVLQYRTASDSGEVTRS